MIHIVHISDLHFWTLVFNPFGQLNKRLLGNLNLLFRRRHYIKPERADSFLEVLRELHADVLLVGGDLTTTAMIKEYEAAASFLAQADTFCPTLHVIPGNHDFYTFESCRHRRFKSYLGRYSITPDTSGYYRLDKGITLLPIPTVRANICSSRGFISKAQLEATHTRLEDTPEGCVIALAHYPYLHNTPDYHTKVSRRLGGASSLRSLLGQSRRSVLYLAGHVHAFSHWRDPQYNNLTQVTSAALFYDKKTHPGGFTEIWIDAETFRIFPWTYRDGWIRGPESLPKPW